MHFPSLHSWFRCSVCFYLKCSSSHNQRVIQSVKKTFFFCQNLFQLMYNQKQRSNVHLRKKHKTADRKGGGVQPLRSAWSLNIRCFFTPSLRLELNWDGLLVSIQGFSSFKANIFRQISGLILSNIYLQANLRLHWVLQFDTLAALGIHLPTVSGQLYIVVMHNFAAKYPLRY